MSKCRVLVLCTGNSCRSQMAEGFLRSFDPTMDVHSAGTNPAPEVHLFAIRVMAEKGIDISESRPKEVGQFMGQSFFAVITVCGDADRSCPSFQGKVEHRIHMPFADPARAGGTPGEILETFRKVRDQIEREFRKFYENEIQMEGTTR